MWGLMLCLLSDITGIPRPTVVRKLKYLIKNNFLHINEKKLTYIEHYRFNIKKSNQVTRSKYDKFK